MHWISKLKVILLRLKSCVQKWCSAVEVMSCWLWLDHALSWCPGPAPIIDRQHIAKMHGNLSHSSFIIHDTYLTYL